MTPIKPSPRPWRVGSVERNLPAAGMVFSGSRPVASCMLRQSNLPGNTEREENEANAEYIVQCVNAYEDMRAALEEICSTTTDSIAALVSIACRALPGGTKGEPENATS